MTSPGTEEKAGPEYLRGRKTFGDKNFLELLHIIKTLHLFTTCIRIRHSIAFTKFSTVMAEPNLALETKTIDCSVDEKYVKACISSNVLAAGRCLGVKRILLLNRKVLEQKSISYMRHYSQSSIQQAPI